MRPELQSIVDPYHAELSLWNRVNRPHFVLTNPPHTGILDNLFRYVVLIPCKSNHTVRYGRFYDTKVAVEGHFGTR